MVPPEGQADEWKVLKPCVKAADMPKWAQRESGEEMGHGAGKRVMEL
jgi:hypothetical protein